MASLGMVNEEITMKTWKFIDGSKATYQDNQFTWAGVIANEIRNMANQALREQGISIESHSVEFVDKCLFKYLNASVKAVKNVYGEVSASKAV